MLSEHLDNYVKTLPEAWPQRANALPGENVYLHVHLVDLIKNPFPQNTTNGYAIIGFNCDIGVRRNNGRSGAVKGPGYCRKALSKQAWHLGDNVPLFDLGDVITPDDNLEHTQEILSHMVAHAHDCQLIPIVMGGGQELALGHYHGLRKAFPGKTIGIINFDAHFDMRPTLENDLGTSMSAFLQIAEHSKANGSAFHYCVLGIQPYSNTATTVRTAESYDVTYRSAEVMRSPKHSNLNTLNEFLNKVDLVYLTIDLDVFAAACAPGVSAAQIFGLYPLEALPLITHICQTGKVIGFDVSELSPKLDIDDRTALLGATLINHFIHSNNHYYTRSAS